MPLAHVWSLKASTWLPYPLGHKGPLKICPCRRQAKSVTAWSVGTASMLTVRALQKQTGRLFHALSYVPCSPSSGLLSLFDFFLRYCGQHLKSVTQRTLSLPPQWSPGFLFTLASICRSDCELQLTADGLSCRECVNAGDAHN